MRILDQDAPKLYSVETVSKELGCDGNEVGQAIWDLVDEGEAFRQGPVFRVL